MTLYKIKVKLYNRKKNEMKTTTQIVKEVKNKMLRRKGVQSRLDYPRNLSHLKKQAMSLLNSSIESAVNKNSTCELNSYTIIEVYF